MASPPDKVLQDYLADTEAVRNQALSAIRDVASSTEAKELSATLTTSTTYFAKLGQASLDTFQQLKLLKGSEITNKNAEIDEKNQEIARLKSQLANATPATPSAPSAPSAPTAPTADDIVQALVQNQQFTGMFSGLARDSKLDALTNTVGALPSQQSLDKHQAALTTAINGIAPAEAMSTGNSPLTQALADIPSQVINGVANHLSECGTEKRIPPPALPDNYEVGELSNFHLSKKGNVVTVKGPPDDLKTLAAFVSNGGRVKQATQYGKRSGILALWSSLEPVVNRQLRLENVEGILDTQPFTNLCREYAETQCTYGTDEFIALVDELTRKEDITSRGMQLLLVRLGKIEQQHFRLIIVGYSSAHEAYLVEAQQPLLPENMDEAEPVLVYTDRDAVGKDRHVHSAFDGEIPWDGMTSTKRNSERANTPSAEEALHPKKTRNIDSSGAVPSESTPRISSARSTRSRTTTPGYLQGTISSRARRDSDDESMSSEISVMTQQPIQQSKRAPSQNRLLGLFGGNKASSDPQPSSQILKVMTEPTDEGAFGKGRRLDIGANLKPIKNKQYLSDQLVTYLETEQFRSGNLNRNAGKSILQMQCVWSTGAKKNIKHFSDRDGICDNCRNPPSGPPDRQCAVLLDRSTLLLKGFTSDNNLEQARKSPDDGRSSATPGISLRTASGHFSTHENIPFG